MAQNENATTSKHAGSHRSDVEEENFVEERRYVGEVRVEAPVDTEVSNDDCPDWSRREYMTPWHFTQLSTNIHTGQ